MREGLTLHSDGNCRLFHFTKEACKFCRISLPRYLVLCCQIWRVHFINLLTSYCRCIVTCYMNASQRRFTYCLLWRFNEYLSLCARALWGHARRETAQSAERLGAVRTATISRSGGIQILSRSQRQNSASNSLCHQSNIYRRESISKDEAAGCRMFFYASFPLLVYSTKIFHLLYTCVNFALVQTLTILPFPQWSYVNLTQIKELFNDFFFFTYQV